MVSAHHLHLLIHALNLYKALHVILSTNALSLSVDAQPLYAS